MKTVLILSILLLPGCSHLFYQPSPHQYVDPAKLKVTYQDVYFDSLDGTKLHAWFFPARDKNVKGTVTLFHGNAQNLSTHFLNLLWLTQNNYNLFVFDYRGYGKSKGEPSQEGIYLDALAAIKKGKELGGAGKYVVYGQSLGGIISLRALVDYKPIEDIDLIVQDSTFSSYKDIAFDRLKTSWLIFPFSPLAFILVSDKYASDKIFHKVKTPVLVVVGQKDPIIPQKFGKKIYKGVASAEKWLWKLPKGSHIDIFHQGNESYRKDFLNLVDGLGRK